jgi:hypothetical protein
MSYLENNQFVTDTKYVNEYNSNKNLDLYYNPVIKYCNTNDNITTEYCKKFYGNQQSNFDSYNQQRFNIALNDKYIELNKKWKASGCFSDLPIPIFNELNGLTSETDRDKRINEYITSMSLNNRNICYTGETIENNKSLNFNSCIYSQNDKFKLCQNSNGDLVLHNLEKKTSKVLNNPRANNNHNKLPRLVVQIDGNVVNYNSDNGAFWSSDTANLPNVKDKNVFLTIRNDGKVVLYNRDGLLVKELDSIEGFENPAVQCCNVYSLMNEPSCSNDYIKSYKVYLNDMNKYCKLNNNIIDKDTCDELFNNEYNLNDFDILITKKKEVCLDPKNMLNSKCIAFNNVNKDHLNKQVDYCKGNPTNVDCRQLYTEYKKINPENEFVKSTDFILLIIGIVLFVLMSGGIYWYFIKRKVNNNNRKNQNNFN